MARLTDTISGAIATFRTPGKQDIRSLKVHFSPVQEGTGDPSPENVRPISGWTGVEVYQSGLDTSNPTTLPIDWTDSAGTVYGGYVDLVSGEVWKTHHKLVVDESSTIGIFPWGGVKTDSTTGMEYATALFMRSANDPRARNIASNLCDKLPYSTDQSKINVAYMYDGDTYGPALSLPTSLIGTTQETLKQYLTGNPFTFVYILREPVLLTTLTPTALRTLIGTNNIWSNANGNVDVEYDFAESREMMEARKRVAGYRYNP